MKKIFLIAILFFLAAVKAESYLKPENQLPSTGENYSFSFPIALTIMEDKLYILDQNSGLINVFQKDSLAFRYKLGETEKLKLDKPVSISPAGNGNIAVSDFDNDRILFISAEGDVTNTIDQIYPWRFDFFQENLYIDLFPGINKAGFYLIEEDILQQEFLLADYFQKNSFHSSLDKYYSWCITDKGFVLSFSGRDEIAFFNINGKEKKIKFAPLPFTYDNTLYGKPQPYQNGFLILATSNDRALSDTTQTVIKYEGFLAFYDFEGNIIDIYDLPPRVWLADSWIINDRKAYIYDSGSLVLNVFKLP